MDTLLRTHPLTTLPSTLLPHVTNTRYKPTLAVKLPDYVHRGENVIIVAPAKVSTTVPSGSREIHALELRSNDMQARYPFVIPDVQGDRDRVGIRLAGREFTIKLPDDVRTGDQIVVVAPAAII